MKNQTKNKKMKAVYCPKCKDTLTVTSKDGDVEVFECENCKFKIKK